MKLSKVLLLIVMLVAILALSGCFPGDGVNYVGNEAGFFRGVWHGWIAPISLIYSLFNDNINIYEVYNNGFRYNIGFYMAIISGFGGFAIFRGKRR